MPNRCSGFHGYSIVFSYFLYSVIMSISQEGGVLSLLGVYSGFLADLIPSQSCPLWKVDGKNGLTSFLLLPPLFLLPVFAYFTMGLGRSFSTKGGVCFPVSEICPCDLLWSVECDRSKDVES